MLRRNKRAGVPKWRLGNLAGRRLLAGRCFSNGLYWAYEMGHAALNPARAFAGATQLYFKNPLNPLAHTTYGKSVAAGDGIVRALDAALRQAGVGPRFHDGRRRARADPYLHRLAAPVLQPAALRAHVLPHAAPAAAQGADRRADVGPLRHAAARHGRSLPAEPRCLHHRLGGRAHGAAVGGPLRSRRLHRLHHQHPASPRRRHPCHRGVPAVGAGAGGDRADGGRQGSLRAALDHADGRPDRHPHQSDRGEQARRGARQSTGSAATSSARCRSRIPA